MHTNKSRPFAVPNHVLLLQAKIMAYFKFPLLFRKKSYCASVSILCLLPALLNWWRMQASSPRHGHPVEAVGPPGIEDLVRHLAEVADRKQQLTEQLVVSQARHAEELVRLRAETAARVPLPEPRTTAHQLLTKLTSQDDLEAYLHMFEVVARREGCDQAEWAQLLAPLLTGKPIQVYNSLSAVSANDYAILKTEILARVGLSPICAAQKIILAAHHPNTTQKSLQSSSLLGC